MQFVRRAHTSAKSSPLYIPRRQNLIARLKELNKLEEVDRETHTKKGKKGVSPCQQVVQNYLENIRRVAEAEDGSIGEAVAVLQDQEQLRHRSEFTNWGQDKWTGVTTAGATAAAARLCQSKGGPESAETFLKTILDEGILPLIASGPVIGAVLRGFSKKKDAEKVIERASEFIPLGKPGSPLLNPQTLALVLDACQSPTVLNQLWDDLVAPTLKRRRLTVVPRIVSSTYLTASFKFDISKGQSKGLVGCVEGNGSVPAALNAIWTFENDCLVGPLLTTPHMIDLIPKARTMEDMWMLLKSSLGSYRGEAKLEVVGYSPIVSPIDMLWEGHDALARRYWGAPLAAKAIRKYIAMGAYQKALGLAGGSLRYGRISMPFNALLEASAQSGNIQMGVSSIQSLRSRFSHPKFKPSKAFLRLLAITPPPWGLLGQPNMLLGRAMSMLMPSAHKWACIVECMLLCGASSARVLQLVEIGMQPAELGPCARRIDMLGMARFKVLKSALRCLCEHFDGAERMASIRGVLALGRQYCGEVLTEAHKDMFVAVVISSLKAERKLLKAIKNGMLRALIGTCIQMGYLPGPKAKQALLHICKTKANYKFLPLTSTRNLSSLGLNVSTAIETIRVEHGVSQPEATLMLADAVRATVIDVGFASIRCVIDPPQRSALLTEVVQKGGEKGIQ